MSHRRFVDADGRSWTVKVVSKGRWRFEAGADHTSPAREGDVPLYAGDDPFELSEEEVRRIFADARPTDAGRGGTAGGAAGRPGGAAGRRSPFGDVYEPKAKPSLFGEDAGGGDEPGSGEDPRSGRRSPFLDDD